MNEVKRLFSFLTAVTLLYANISSASVSADETDIIDWNKFQDDRIEVIESDTGYFPEVIDKEEPIVVTTAASDEEINDPEIPDEEDSGEPAVTDEYDPDAEPDDAPGDEIPEENPPEETPEEQPSPEPEPEPEPVPQPEEQPQQPAQPPSYLPPPEAGAFSEGCGYIEGLVDKRVFQVSLPVKNGSLDYVADPQGLICGTEARKHPDTFYDPGSNVYFNNGKTVNESGDTITQYSDVSEPLTVINKSSCAVEVVARVSVSFAQGAANPVVLAPDRNWDNVTRPSICLSVIKSDDLSEVVLSRKEKIITASVAGCPDVYHYVYDEDENGVPGYSYKMMTDDEIEQLRKDPSASDKDTEFSEFSLCLTAECNRDGEWDHEIDYDFPSASIVWNVGLAASAKPFMTKTEYSVAYGEEIEMPYSLGAFDTAAKKINSAKYKPDIGESIQLLNNEQYMTLTDDTITLTEKFSEFAKDRNGGVITFKFDDRNGTEIEVKLDRDAPPSLEEKECYISGDKSGQLTIGFNPGTGSKAANGVSAVTFGNTDLSTSAYSSVYSDRIVLNAGAVRMIQLKNGGKVYITFDDEAHTRCGYKVNISK